jgi:predicted ATPase/DNA-binding SARP family transcriptional activator
MVMEFRALGPLAVIDGNGVALSLGGAKQRAVLGILLLSTNRVVAIDRLVDDIWGDDAPARPAGTLQVYVHNLRKVLDPDRPAGEEPRVLITRPPGYAIELDREQLDLLRFEDLVAAGRAALAAGDAHAAGAQLQAALELWRGPVLADLADEPWVARESARLDELRLGALEDRIDADLAAGRHHELIPELETLVATNGLRERAWEQLMLALYRDARQAESLAAFQRARETLIEELGIEPGPALVRLEQAILDHDARLDLASSPSVATASRPAARPPTFPVDLTTLVGRDGDATQLVELVAQHRFVTITGPAGCGKTRLAVESAQRAVARFDGGAAFVDLGVVDVNDGVAVAVGRALGLDHDATMPRVAMEIEQRGVLIALDSCEHVIDECRELLLEIAACGTRGCVLATSREPLGVTGEHVWTVEPLAVPTPEDAMDVHRLEEFESVRLFVYRARSALASFTLDEDNAAAVAELVRRLDGLPLAIELAAARIRTLPPADLAARLDDRFRILTPPDRVGGVRPRTLRAAIDWSYDLLTDDERLVLCHIAACSSGFDLDAAEAIAAPRDADVVSVLFRLVDRSLVVVQRRSGVVRYRLLETIQQYALEKLRASDDEAAVRDRHAAWYASLAERTVEMLRRDDSVSWIDRIELEYDNLRAALAHALTTGDSNTALRIAGSLGSLWLRRGYTQEGRALLADVIHATRDNNSEWRAKALLAAAALALAADDLSGAEKSATESRAAFAALGDVRGDAYTTCLLGSIARRSGDYERAHSLGDEAVAAFRSLDDAAGIAGALTELGVLSRVEGDYALAAALLEEGVGLFDALRGPSSGRSLLDAALQPRGRSYALSELGHLAETVGDPERAAILLTESIQVAAATGNRLGVADGIEAMATLMVESGDAARAATLLAAADAARDADAAFEPNHDAQQRLRVALRGQLGDKESSAAEQRGRALSHEQLLRYVADCRISNNAIEAGGRP